jgi:antitoxin component of RelBE/YafQ-DinJ toxin-antitoxin module
MIFEINDYNPCVVNSMLNKEAAHYEMPLDNVKSNHQNANVTDEFKDWKQKMQIDSSKVTVKETGGKIIIIYL